MRLVVDAGRWVLGPPTDHPPAAAVLEVSGAVLEWTVDDPNGAAATRITLTDIAAADWLWRVVGPVGHAALLAAVAEHPGTEVLDLAGVEAAAEVLAPLRRLGVGHWLRRWWPESSREGIVGLDSAVLDGELALLTNLAQEFFTEDTLDSDLEGLLAPHRSRLLALAGDGDPRVAAMARACADLADDVGVWSSAGTAPDGAPSSARRENYALAAGRHGDRDSAAIAGGVGSVDWMAVPPRVFDAADRTIDWTVQPADASVIATVRVATSNRATDHVSARGIAVRLSSGAISGSGVLDANGTAALRLSVATGEPLGENQAWDHDWSPTTVTVGPVHRTDGAAAAVRQRLRDFARARLAHPGPDAFLAEVLAAESDY